MKNTYGPIELNFPNRADWSLSRVLREQANRYGNKPFLTEPGHAAFTYKEIDAVASRIAGGLQKRGFETGDRLQIYLDNCSEYILAWFGATRAGVVEVPTNTSYFGDFLAHTLNVTTPRGIVVGANYVSRFAEIGPTLKKLNPVFFVIGENSTDEIRTLKGLGFRAEQFDALLSENPIDSLPRQPRRELGAILFTSGTTGPSKGVMMSHAQLYFFAQQSVSVTQLTEADTYVTVNPLFHGNAQFLSIYPTLIAGGDTYLWDKFSPSRFAERLAESKGTVTNFVGVMMDWVGKQAPNAFEKRSRLRCVFAAPTAWTVADDLKKRFGIEAFVECFGQTEICLPMMTPYGVQRPPGATGYAVDEWFDIRLANPDTDEVVDDGQIGELQIRIKEDWTLNSGYYGMPEATANSRRNLWFHTGDGMRMDNDGWYFFADRLKDCLRRRGENISSFEVERPILQHPAVKEAAAVGLPADEEAGEDEVGVFIIPKDGATVSPEEISDFVKDKLPEFLTPRFIQVVDKFPMTPSGKIQKAELRRVGRKEAWDRKHGQDR